VNSPLLSVADLRIAFHTDAGPARAVDGVSFTVDANETVGLVGESGSGKSLTALSLLRLPEPALRSLRGRRIAMVFQEPMTALNPVLRVGEQVAEVVRVHTAASRREAWERAVAMLAQVGIPAPAERAAQYPHELSGGMRQRVMIAMALILEPALLVADEPTTALDVTIQAQILELLGEMRERTRMAMLLITHDLGVVAETASRVLVMYGGEIVEEAPVASLFAAPAHPYTEGLLAAVPTLDATRERLRTIPGTVPPPTAWPAGCRFRDRCPHAWDRCAQQAPALVQVAPAHRVRCHLAQEPERRRG
jgi:oligopeptide/dipeptide ABC transporter ATP-binding protein